MMNGLLLVLCLHFLFSYLFLVVDINVENWRKNSGFFIVFTALVCPLFFRLVLLAGVWYCLRLALSTYHYLIVTYIAILVCSYIQNLSLHPLINIIPISLYNSLSLNNSFTNIINKLLPFPLPLLPLLPNSLLHILTPT